MSKIKRAKAHGNIGLAIKQKGLAFGISQKEFAKAAGFRSQQFLSNIERGVSSMPYKAIKKLSLRYNFSEEPLIWAAMIDFRSWYTK